LEFIINFLTEKFNEGLQYSTVNGYRAAISAYHNGFQGVKVGQHPQISDLFKGMFNRRPPQPRYMETWDVEQVLDLFKKWPEDQGLDLKQLSLKVTTLMALTGVLRRSELQLLRVDEMLDLGDKIQFQVGGLTKTRKVGEGPVTFEFWMYEHEPKLDVTQSIRAYISRTSRLRKNQSQLLVSFVKPHKAIVACSVARWLQMCMELAGIDTSIYKGHSTKSASVSRAKAGGLSAGEIMARAKWRRESTFRKFYNREDSVANFQRKVLNDAEK
jgi:hypothetical protein